LLDKVSLASAECGSFRVSASNLAHGYTGSTLKLSPTLIEPAFLFFVVTSLLLHSRTREVVMVALLRELWLEDRGQDIAEYAVMLAAILVIVIGTIRLVGGNANNVFSTVASSLAQ
jgi:Flp pilus assembly pilin Flp